MPRAGKPLLRSELLHLLDRAAAAIRVAGVRVTRDSGLAGIERAPVDLKKWNLTMHHHLPPSWDHVECVGASRLHRLPSSCRWTRRAFPRSTSGEIAEQWSPPFWSSLSHVYVCEQERYLTAWTVAVCVSVDVEMILTIYLLDFLYWRGCMGF